MARIWFPVRAENLVRHRSGTFYLQATVQGKKIRRSLKTVDLKVAKLKRDLMMETIRRASVKEPSGIRTIGDALTLVVARLVGNPRNKPRTNAHHKEIEAQLTKSLPVNLAAASWTKDDAARWWGEFTAGRSAIQVNKALSVVKKMALVIIEAGLRFDDPVKGIQRLREPSSAVHDLPARARVLRVIVRIKWVGQPYSEESSNMVAFLLWSGMRIGELRWLEWSDIGDEWLTIRISKTGRRRVPISRPLRKLIERMRTEDVIGPVFSIVSPRLALGAACKHVGIPHLRIHDLRHLFATSAIEQGVDIPTVSRWLGHKDGGALAMRTYGHIRDQHSLEQARKLK